MTDPVPMVATLWIGDTLRWLERVGLSNLAAAGHVVKLYACEPVADVPEGIVVEDARAIWEPDETERGLHLAAKTDEIWVDGDIVALHPITRNAAGYAMGWEEEGRFVNNAVLGAPRGSAAIALLRDFVKAPGVPPWLGRGPSSLVTSHPRASQGAAAGTELLHGSQMRGTRCRSLRARGVLSGARPTWTSCRRPGARGAS